MANKIFQEFLKDNPEASIIKVADYSSELYLIVASEGEDIDYNSSCYAVNKKTGEWYSFNPLEDLDGFNNAFLKKVVEG